MTSDQIRRQFIDFFVQRHGHTFVPSSPVVPLDDPTLLFTNAGMNQFKPYFLGQQRAAWTRVANTQKCIRAGGKHNDLDDVGRSRRHHTFFEMLGNWSFGDYFKRGAIEMSWELLTKVWKLDPTRLHVSVYAGDPATGVPRDDEAVKIWKDVANLSDDHIHFGSKDNFWEMGDTGPCGPCTEIFVDRTPDRTGGPSVLSGEDPRVMEIWNNVFIQYNRDGGGKLTPLPEQHVDTGMGFERITQVLQNVDDNYAIDLFVPFWKKLSELSGKQYKGTYPKTNAPDPVAEAADQQLRTDIAFRVIADHIRALTFALTDGAVPSNEGRGYVLRRILRRAVRFGRQQLGLRDPFLHTLVPVVADVMGEAFRELRRDPQRVIDLIKDEEVSFGRTLDRGIELFEEAALEANLQANLTAQGQLFSDSPPRPVTIAAQDAFKLHDTYGFPIDLTRIMAEERGMTVDIAGYEKLMEEAREKARAGGKEAASKVFDLPPAALAELSAQNVPATDDQPKFGREPITATLKKIWTGDVLDQTADAEMVGGEPLAVILDRTNFYAEMGGQVGDAGELKSSSGARFEVETTRLVGSYVLHIGRMKQGVLRAGNTVTGTVAPQRVRTEQNHTSTHLANWALREVLGDDAQQKGSLVDPEKLRFDFSQGKAMTDDEIGRVETLVNDSIGKKLPVYAELAPQEQALTISGLRAVFGEKYPPMVRVVSVGAPVSDLLKDPTNKKWRQYSIEFCGGTHLRNSGDAEGFVVTSEESVSKGIRRITALTGGAASAARSSAEQLDATITRARSVPDSDLRNAIHSIQKLLGAENLPLRARRRGQQAMIELQAKLKVFEKSQKQAAVANVDVASISAKLLSEAEAIGPGKLVVGELPGAGDDELRATMDSLRKKQPSGLALMLASSDGTKVSFCSAVSDDLIALGLKAGDWIRETAKVAGGGGGGRPQMAQAGGKDPSKLPDALARARRFAQDIVK